MTRLHAVRRLLLALAALLPFAASPGVAAPAPCRAVTAEGARYTVCVADLRQVDLRLHLRDGDGRPFGSLAALAGSAAGRDLLWATNAGMYEADGSPVGLYVEDGREAKAANTRDGPGNFHLKPNGVFFAGGGRAGVLETRAFLRRRPAASLATQSGPLLVEGGRIHPRFSEDGPSRKIRNGVGLRDPRTVVVAISDEPVSFGAFARLFRDELGCPDALFLDGSVSVLHAPAIGRRDVSFRAIGPILAAFPRSNGPLPAPGRQRNLNLDRR